MFDGFWWVCGGRCLMVFLVSFLCRFLWFVVGFSVGLW